MASALNNDPLIALRSSIKASSAVRLTQAANDTSFESAPFPIAHYVFFDISQPQGIALSNPTRFHSSENPIDLRSIVFAWLQKDAGLTEYSAAVNEVNSEISSVGQDVRVLQLSLVERSDLRGWLQGDLNEIEQIHDIVRPYDPNDTGAGADGQILPGVSNADFLKMVYASERKMGDRNTVLRGTKPQNFENVKRVADILYKKTAHKQGEQGGAALPTRALSTSGLSHSGKKRHDPIILLSPSQSSPLQLSNVKAFLGESHFEQPTISAAIVQLTYMIREVRQLSSPYNLTGKYKFIITDSTEQFRPDYWDRVVAVFTTGQAWQFKSYKWNNAPELFANVLGIHLGWRGEKLPETVKGWGSGVRKFEIDKYRGGSGAGYDENSGLSQAAQRNRDREVVEAIWQAIGESMRAKGWAK